MSAEVAYRPRAAFSDPDCLGTVFVSDTVEVNVRELVQGSADGTFVVSDPAVIAKLDEYPALKRASVPEGAPPAEEAGAGAPATSLDDLTKEDLLGLPEAEGIDGAERLRVGELRDRIARCAPGR
jgi:hypothetical protein